MRPGHCISLERLVFYFVCWAESAVYGSVALFIMGYKMSDNIIPPILTVFFMIMGVLMFIFGLMSEIMMKIYYGTHVDVPYSIREVMENEDE